MTIDWESLRAPFGPDEIHWRVGSKSKDGTKGLALAYIDARDVMARFDSVIGPASWQDEYSFEGAVIVCRIGVQCGVDAAEWVWKTDGAGKTQIEAEKGGISDAFKRAAVKWGVGRHLYDIASPWVPIESFGRSHRITKDGMAWLRSGAATEPPVPQGPQKRSPAKTKAKASPPDGSSEPANKSGKVVNQNQIKLLFAASGSRLKVLNLDPEKDGVAPKDLLDDYKKRAGLDSIKDLPQKWMDHAMLFIDAWEPGK